MTFEEVQSKVEAILGREFKDFWELRDALEKVVRKFGGEVLPANERDSIGFVWAKLLDGREMIENPLMDRRLCGPDQQSDKFCFETAANLNELSKDVK